MGSSYNILVPNVKERDHSEDLGVDCRIILECIHAYRKRLLKWVATLSLGDINTEAWSSGMGAGRGANKPTL
jgi:hypothetical protein